MDIREKISAANECASKTVISADPQWIDILPAIDVVDGMSERSILHSGPPISFPDMCPLHQRSMISGALFEGWASNDAEAKELLGSGKIQLECCMSVNTVGAGVGVITPSMQLLVVEDVNSGKRAATFFPEAEFQGGLCGWGLYTPEIAANLRHIHQELLPLLRDVVRRVGGVALKPILSESLQMGDENHTRQSAADLLFDKQVLPELFRSDFPRDQLMAAVDFVVKTPRFFHGFGQAAARAALLGAEDLPYSTMVTAMAGNGVEYGIKVAGLGNQWFTAPAPIMDGLYTSSKFSRADQLPWMGDSCIVECYGMGGFAAAASPIVCSLRGLKLTDAISATREMERITIARNTNFSIPNLDFDFLPVGIDVRKVVDTGIAPLVHGGMFNHEGGLIGVGSSRVPMECFEKALRAFAERHLGA